MPSLEGVPVGRTSLHIYTCICRIHIYIHIHIYMYIYVLALCMEAVVCGENIIGILLPSFRLLNLADTSGVAGNADEADDD